MSKPELDFEPGVLRVFQSKDETKSFYDKIASVYDLLSEASERPMREAGLKLLAAAAGEAILEIGCGTGQAHFETSRGSPVILGENCLPQSAVPGLSQFGNCVKCDSCTNSWSKCSGRFPLTAESLRRGRAL